MSSISDYKTRLSGKSISQSFKDNAKKIISNSFTDSISYKSVTINGITTDVHIIDDSQIKEQKNILTQSTSPIQSGDIVVWNSDNWLILIVDDMQYYYRGTISKCVDELKWLDENGVVKQTYFTYKTDGLTNFGLDEGRVVTVGNERRHILIQNNADTVKLKKDKRFIVDERAWKCTAVDRIGRDGLIYMVIEEGSINTAADDLVNGIADSVGNVANYTITILNGDTFSINAGSTLQLQAEVKNNDIVVSKTVVWSVDDDSIATINASGMLSSVADGTVTVSVKLEDDTSITDSATVTVQDVLPNTYSLDITSTSSTPNEIKNGQSKIYSVNVYIDAALVDENVTWSLFADNQIDSTTLATITSQTGTSCTVKNNNVSSGYAQLKAEHTSSGTIAWKRIQMKPLF